MCWSKGTFELLVPRAVLYQRLLDARLLAQCIPGCEVVERLDAARYKAGVAIALAGIKARFDLIVELTEQEPPGRIVCVTRGEEGSLASQLSAESEITLHELAAQQHARAVRVRCQHHRADSAASGSAS